MNITEMIKRKRFEPGKGVTELPPEKGLKGFLFLLSAHLWKLVTLNLLFLAFSIPVVTMPAAFCGMNRVLIKLIRDGNCFLWAEFIKEFKANLFKSLPFGILSAFLLFDAYYLLSLSISVSDGFDLFWGTLGFICLGFEILFSGYVYVFLPTLSLANRYIAKNAFIFMITEWKANILILGCVLFMLLVSLAFFPCMLFFLVFITISLTQMVVCTAVNEPLQRRIIGPYEERQKEGN